MYIYIHIYILYILSISNLSQYLQLIAVGIVIFIHENSKEKIN